MARKHSMPDDMRQDKRFGALHSVRPGWPKITAEQRQRDLEMRVRNAADRRAMDEALRQEVR